VGHEFLQVQTTTDSRAEAMEIARAAVQARLAAGCQVAGPMTATFWWNDEIERAEEWLVLLKTTADRCAELITFIAEQHSYDEPEILAIPIVAGTAGCLDWLREETRPAAPRAVPGPREATDGGAAPAGRVAPGASAAGRSTSP
jgi:periplasmic divalent cation tolerance protein